MRRNKKNNTSIYKNQGIYFQFIISRLFKSKPLSNHTSKFILDEINEEKKILLNKSNKKTIKEITQIDVNLQPFKIPNHWVWLKIEDVIEQTENLNIQKDFKPDFEINYVDIASIDNNLHIIKETNLTTVSKLSSRARRVLKKGYMLYSLVRPYLNNIAIIEDEKPNMIGSTGFVVFKGIYLKNEFIKYWLLSEFVREYYLEMISGFNSPSISVTQFLNTPIPIPPIEEQEIIINFIESLSSSNEISQSILPNEIENGLFKLTSLQNKTNKLIEILSSRLLLVSELRKNIVQEALQGKHTVDWRKENQVIKDSNELLEFIKSEKKALLDAQNNRLVSSNFSNLTNVFPYELPPGWLWMILDDITVFKNGKAHEQFIDENGNYILINSKFVSTNGKKNKHTNNLMMPMFKSEIAIVMSDVPNGRALGRTFLIDENNKYSLNQRIGGLILIKGILPEFLMFVLNRNEHYLAFNDGKKQTNLKKDHILSCPIPLPSFDEQIVIVDKINILLSKCDQLENEIEKSKKNALILMQSALKEVFDNI